MMASHTERKAVVSIGGQLAMKPTSEQTQNAVLGFFRYGATETIESAPAPHPTVVDPSLAYGCVDWYIYPNVKDENVATSSLLVRL